jgi:hypothetical protein
MATLRIRLYDPPDEELARLVSDRPSWVERLLESYGASFDRPSASGLVEALSEEVGRRLSSLAMVMRTAEERGWTVELTDGAAVISTGLAPDSARRAFEEAGVWHLVRRLTGALEAEFV